MIRGVFKPKRCIKFANSKCEYLLFHVEQKINNSLIIYIYIKLQKYILTDYQKWIYKNSNSDLYNIRQYFWSSDCIKGMLKVIVPRRTIILLNLD